MRSLMALIVAAALMPSVGHAYSPELERGMDARGITSPVARQAINDMFEGLQEFQRKKEAARARGWIGDDLPANIIMRPSPHPGFYTAPKSTEE